MPQFSVGDAISYGWERFRANPLPWILVVLIGSVITGGINTVGRIGGNVALSIVFSILAVAIGFIFQLAYVRGALDEVSGARPDIAAFFRLNFGPAIGTAVLVAIGTYIGFALVVIPGIAFLFLTYWATTFVIDHHLDPIAGIKASFSVIKENAGPLFLLALANAGLTIVGLILCGVGLLVAIPVATIASVYAYRYFTRGPIAPVGFDAAQPPYPPEAPPPYPPQAPPQPF